MYVALLEVEGGGYGVERLEGKREVAVVYFAYVVFLGSKVVYLREVVNIEFDAVGCC